MEERQIGNTENMEKLIQRLNGVIAVKCVADDGGNLTDVHILADCSRSPKQLSRDVQSAVSAAYGCPVSHNIISIAQIDEAVARRCDPPGRPRISGLKIAYSENAFEASVTLGMGEREFSGSSRKALRPGSRMESAACAAVDAVNRYIGGDPFTLCDIQKAQIGIYPVVVAIVTYRDGRRGGRVLTGTSLIREDEYFAAVKAVLSAVNRLLPRLAAR